MSNLSRHRNKLIAGAVIATAGSVASASPFVTIQMFGRDISVSGSPAASTPTSGIVHQAYDGTPPDLSGFTQNLSVNIGDTVVYAILSFLSPVGSTNTSFGGRTITSIGASESGNDGIQGLYFDTYQLATDLVQVDFKNVKASSMAGPAEGLGLFTYADTNNWHGVTGATGGALGLEAIAGHRTGPNNDILTIKAGTAALPVWYGDRSNTPEAVVGTGLFVVAAQTVTGTSPVRMRYTPAAQGGGGGAFQINDGANPTKDTINPVDSTELGSDPFIQYSQLNVTAVVPEPGSLSLLGLAAAGLLARRKRKTNSREKRAKTDK